MKSIIKWITDFVDYSPYPNFDFDVTHKKSKNNNSTKEDVFYTFLLEIHERYLSVVFSIIRGVIPWVTIEQISKIVGGFVTFLSHAQKLTM